MNGSITPVPYPNDYASTVLSPSKVYIITAPNELLESFCAQPDKRGLRRINNALSDTIPQPWVEEIRYNGYTVRPLDTELTNVLTPTPLSITIGKQRFLLSFVVSVTDEKQPCFGIANCRYLETKDDEENVVPVDDGERFSLPRRWAYIRLGRVTFVWAGQDQQINEYDILHRFGSDYNAHNRTFLLNYSLLYDKYKSYAIHLFYHDNEVFAILSPANEKLFDTVAKMCNGPAVASLIKDQNVMIWKDHDVNATE